MTWNTLCSPKNSVCGQIHTSVCLKGSQAGIDPGYLSRKRLITDLVKLKCRDQQSKRNIIRWINIGEFIIQRGVVKCILLDLITQSYTDLIK